MQWTVSKPIHLIWEFRLKEPVWKLKDAVDWISCPKDWELGSLLEKLDGVIPKDIEAYKARIYKSAVSEIKKKRMRGEYDQHHQDYLVFSIQFLVFAYREGLRLPPLCNLVIQNKQQQIFADAVASLVKSKKMRLSENMGMKKRRWDQDQNLQLLAIIEKECSHQSPSSYEELFNRPAVDSFVKTMTDAEGKFKRLTKSYLKRLIAPCVPDEIKKAGRRPNKG